LIYLAIAGKTAKHIGEPFCQKTVYNKQWRSSECCTFPRFIGKPRKQKTWRHTVYRSWTGDSCIHATAIGVSWSTVPLCGTVCRLRYAHRTRHWTYSYSKINWRLSSSDLSTECAFAALANLRGINHLIIIIIIIIDEHETLTMTRLRWRQSATLSERHSLLHV